MRFHPRRHGAYNFSARAASAFTNSYFKHKKQKERLRATQENVENPNPNTYVSDSGAIGCLIVFGIIVLIIILKACSG